MACKRDRRFSGWEGMVDRNDLNIAPKHCGRARADENQAARGNMIIQKPMRRWGEVAVEGLRWLRY
jgi:hypothetical protein